MARRTGLLDLLIGDLSRSAWSRLVGQAVQAAIQQFIDKVRDVVGLYLDPPEMALVQAVDETSQIQLWTGQRRCYR